MVLAIANNTVLCLDVILFENHVDLLSHTPLLLPTSECTGRSAQK